MPLIPPGVPLWVATAQPFPVVSDAFVLGAVGAIAPKAGWPAPKGLGVLTSPPPPFAESVLELLRVLSVAYSPPAPGAFWATARWGLLRYFWAFGAPGPPGLRLSGTVATLPTRLKGLLAEDFGVALAQRVARDLVPVPAGATVSWVNGELALATAAVGPFGVVPLAAPNAGPDYFLVVTSGAVVTPYAVEAKGTTGTAWIKQMRHAARQLTAVGLVPPGGGPPVPPPGFVISSELRTVGITVRVLDPEGDWSGSYGSRRPERPTEQRTIAREGAHRLTIQDPEGFRRDLLDLGAAQLLGYAGQTGRAVGKVPERARIPAADDLPPDTPLETESTDVGEFRGTRVSGRLPGGRELHAFYGVESEVLSALHEDDPQPALAAQGRWAERTRGRRSGAASESAQEGGGVLVAYGDDGTILRVRAT